MLVSWVEKFIVIVSVVLSVVFSLKFSIILVRVQLVWCVILVWFSYSVLVIVVGEGSRKCGILFSQMMFCYSVSIVKIRIGMVFMLLFFVLDWFVVLEFWVC